MTQETPTFDGFADAYEAALQKGISVSGESKDYFAEKRVAWLKSVMGELRPERVLDYGCGTGSAVPFLQGILGAQWVLGVDISSRSLEVARRTFPVGTHFQTLEETIPEATVDLAYCNGVFHHIPLAERAGAVQAVFRALKPGGLFAFWENNPWNLGTQYIMWRIPFDREAIKLAPPVAVNLLKAGGFKIERVDFQFIFPRRLGFLRGTEKNLASLPLGAQYQVLCRKA